MVRAVAIVAAAVALLLTLVWVFQRRLIYLPSTTPVPSAGTVIPGARDVELHTSDGLTLGAWFVPSEEPGAVAVLVASGNAGDRSVRARARALAARGMSVLLFDYRGYGGNPGSPSESGLATDVRAARELLVRGEGVPADRIVYYGESLGAAVVTELASEHPPGGLVLRSPFTDLVLDHLTRAQMVIADLSFGNPNVYYELALRQALKKPLVQITRASDRLPFDVGQFRTVVIDMTDIYTLVPALDLHRQEITRQCRAALEDGEVAESPISCFYPSFWEYLPKL